MMAMLYTEQNIELLDNTTKIHNKTAKTSKFSRL